jgi:tetratricopeptide (TPR) repeat protein
MAQSARMARIEQLLLETPTDVELRYMLGMEYLSLGDDRAAVIVFEEIIRQNPYVPAYHMAGQALNRLGRVTDACQILQAGIRAAKNTGNLHALSEMEGLLATIE